MLALRVLVVVVSTVFLLGGWGDGARAQDGEKGSGSGVVTLEIEGEEGVSVSGLCSVGEERREIGGEVPQSFEFDVEDRELSCEIHKQGGQGDALEVALSGEGSRSVQRIEGTEGTVRLTYKGGAVSSSMSSFSSARADTADAPSSAADDAVRGGEDGESLADRIQQRVDEILERAMPW